MSVPVVTVAASISVEVFLSGTLLTYRHSAFPVTDDAGDPVGPVTLNRLRQIPAAERARTTVAQAACPLPQVPARRPDEPLSDVIGRLHSGCSEGRALVFDNGRLAGIVSARDVMRTLQWAGLSSARAALRTSWARHDVTPAGAGRPARSMFSARASSAAGAGAACRILAQRHFVVAPGGEDRFEDTPAVLGGVAADGKGWVTRPYRSDGVAVRAVERAHWPARQPRRGRAQRNSRHLSRLFYEQRPLPYPEPGYGYPEAGQIIVNVTNGKLILLLADDSPFDIRYGRLAAHERTLDLRAGVLRRSADWQSPAGAGCGCGRPAWCPSPSARSRRSPTRWSRSGSRRGSSCSPRWSPTKPRPRSTAPTRG